MTAGRPRHTDSVMDLIPLGHSLDPLTARFNAERHKIRVMALVSPT